MKSGVAHSASCIYRPCHSHLWCNQGLPWPAAPAVWDGSVKQDAQFFTWVWQKLAMDSRICASLPVAWAAEGVVAGEAYRASMRDWMSSSCCTSMPTVSCPMHSTLSTAASDSGRAALLSAQKRGCQLLPARGVQPDRLGVRMCEQLQYKSSATSGSNRPAGSGCRGRQR